MPYLKKGRKIEKLSLEILKALIDRTFESAKDLIDEVVYSHHYTELVWKKMYKRVYNLERTGYVERKKARNNKVNESFFHLTPKGKLSVLKYLHLEKITHGRWDGRWRVVIFDIPESLKKWRGYLRYNLRDLGFVALQKSVYITPHPVTGELDELLKEWGLRKYFRYLTVSEVDGERNLKEKFGIK